MNLFLIVKKKYFDQINSWEKTEEFRLVTPYWTKRLVGRKYNYIIFQNGYSKKSTRIELKYMGYEIKNIRHEFFGNEQVAVFAIKLGKKVA